jgi:ABC-type polysaccharide/polyol phosphate export permease
MSPRFFLSLAVSGFIYFFFHDLSQIVVVFIQNLFISLPTMLNSECVDRIYSIELEIKDTTYIAGPSLYLNMHLKIESER